MSSEYKPPVWPRPPEPSPQLKVVLDYLDYLSKWDLETLSQLSTSYFTQVTLPASLHIPARSKKEDIESLHQFRDSLKAAHLEVGNRQDHPTLGLFRGADQMGPAFVKGHHIRR
jgi:hypothetical protein